MADVRAGGAYVEIGYKDTGLEAGLRGAADAMQSFAGYVQSFGMEMMKIGGLILAPIALSVKGLIEAGSQASDEADRLGATAEEIQTLGFVARTGSSDVGELAQSLKFLQKNLQDAEKEGSPAALALERIGLTAKDFAGLSIHDQFLKLADGMATLKAPADRTNVALDMLGRAGTKMIPILSGGSAEILRLEGVARSTGGVISNELAERVDYLSDFSLNKMWMTIAGVGNEIGAIFIPIVESAVEWITTTAQAVQVWISRNNETIMTIAKIGAILLGVGAVLLVFGTIVLFVSKVITGFRIMIMALRMTMVYARGSALKFWLSLAGPVALLVGTALIMADIASEIGNIKKEMAGVKSFDVKASVQKDMKESTSAIQSIQQNIQKPEGGGITAGPSAAGGASKVGVQTSIDSLIVALNNNTSAVLKSTGGSGVPAGGFYPSATTHDVVSRGRAGAAKSAKPRG